MCIRDRLGRSEGVYASIGVLREIWGYGSRTVVLRLLALLWASTVLSKDGARIMSPLEDRLLVFWWLCSFSFPWLLWVASLWGGFGRGLLHPSQSL